MRKKLTRPSPDEYRDFLIETKIEVNKMIETSREEAFAVEFTLVLYGCPSSSIFLQEVNEELYLDLVESLIPEEKIKYAKNVVWQILAPRITCKRSAISQA
jgi:hypothetical protein